MIIRYLGHSCFEITSKNGAKIITDPYTKVGYELPERLDADVVTCSHGHFDHNYVEAVNAKAILSKSGEYTIGGIDFRGVDSYHDPKMGALRGNNVIFLMKIDDMTLCHMGDIGEECTQALVDRIGKVDVLLIPVGGTYTIDPIGAKKYIDAIAPKVVIPMHYKPQDGALDILGIQSFLQLYTKEEIRTVIDGVISIDASTSGIVYMERVK